MNNQNLFTNLNHSALGLGTIIGSVFGLLGLSIWGLIAGAVFYFFSNATNKPKEVKNG